MTDVDTENQVRLDMSKEWASLGLGVAGVLVASLVLIAGKLLMINVAPEAYFMFLGFEIPAIVVGVLWRQSTGGRAGLATSLCLLVLSL